jgi:hypothetical protein
MYYARIMQPCPEPPCGCATEYEVLVVTESLRMKLMAEKLVVFDDQLR